MQNVPAVKPTKNHKRCFLSEPTQDSFHDDQYNLLSLLHCGPRQYMCFRRQFHVQTNRAFSELMHRGQVKL